MIEYNKITAPTPKAEQYYNKKIRGKTFVTGIDFNPNSKDTFQEKLLNVVQAERKE